MNFASKKLVSVAVFCTLLVITTTSRVYFSLRPPSYSYMVELNSTIYPVDSCSFKDNVLTYKKDDLVISQICNDCKCQRRIYE